MNDRIVGFNEGQINECLLRIKEAYDKFYQALKGGSETKFVQVMPNYWASPDAIKFFNQFKTAFDQLIDQSNIVYESIFNSIKSAGQYWAEATGLTGWIPSVSFYKNERKIDISCVKDCFEDGTRGVDKVNAETKAQNGLGGVLNEINNALTTTVKATEGSGFVGEEQQEQLNSTLEQLKIKINKIFEAQITGDQGVLKAIEATVQGYKDVAAKIKNTAFTNKTSGQQ